MLDFCGNPIYVTKVTTLDLAESIPLQGGPPPLAFLAEARAFGELRAFRRARLNLLRELPRWPSRPVLVLPGFLSSDWATAPLRGVLSGLGHDVSGWNMGRNFGLRPGVFESVEALFLDKVAASGQPVALIGWSLGGLYAAELARRYPHHTQQLITMGSPVSGHLTANNMWRTYERIAGHSIDRPPVEWQPGAVPGVPFLAIQAEGDGVVHPRAARARPGPLVENIMVPGSHCGLGWNIAAVRLIADRLARR